MGELDGARPPHDGAIVVHALDSQIFQAFGTELVTLERAEGARRRIACKVEVGAFRFKVGFGDTDDVLAVATVPDHEVGDGSVAFVVADGIFYLSRPNIMTFQGVGGSDVMSYWFI